MSQKPHYIDGEKVLCYHGPLLYEAKCLKSQIKDKTLKYFIHYSGWNKNWDEWVPECRVLKYNEVNLGKQKELANTHHTKKSKKSKSSKSSSKKVPEKEKEVVTAPVVVEKPLKQPKIEKRVSVAPPAECASKPPEPKRAKPPEPKKVKPPAERKFEDEPKLPVEIKLNIPGHLQNWLIDDGDLISHKKKLLRLPARITVDHIIANFVKEKVSVKGLTAKKEVTIIHIANRIRDCFNVLLGKRLLYKFERPQYAEILAEHANLRMCEIYGAIHLLRMFTTLGNMLTPIAEKGNELASLVNHMEDFIRYMGTNPTFFSLDDYVVATPEYHRRALM